MRFKGLFTVLMGKLKGLSLSQPMISTPSFFIHQGKPVDKLQALNRYSSFSTNDDLKKGHGKTMLAKDLAILVEESSHKDERKPKSRMDSSFSTNDDLKKGHEKIMLAKDLAFLVEESSHKDERKPKSRMELKRSLELRVKKRVKEQFIDGKFRNLMVNVIADPNTLQDAYNCIKLNSNVDISLKDDSVCFNSLGKELLDGNFDVRGNTFRFSTRGIKKEVLVLPNPMTRIIQEAIRMVLETVYKPHFSKISHGCRSGRDHSTALRYIKKEICSPSWWFTLILNKKVESSIVAKLILKLEDKIEDNKLFGIIRSMFDAQVLNFEFGGFPKGHGLPQEGVLSPVLMNVYLDLFDQEFYRLSMRYEALHEGADKGDSHSKLRNWFRRQLKENDCKCMTNDDNSGHRVHCCRFMDEIFFAISGSKDIALSFKSEIIDFFKNSLFLDVDDKQTEILPCDGPNGFRFLGAIVKRSVREGPATSAVHKLKEKVRLFASQKQDAWNAGSVRIGKKWLAHGLKKVKESEIKHLMDGGSSLSKISSFRKAGMETDHWYKVLMKVWMQDIKAKAAENEESILSKYVAELALPHELTESYHEFLKRVDEYVSSETAATLALLPNSSSNTGSVILAPTNVIKKRLFRYGLTTSEGYPRVASLLVLQDSLQIIDWFAGIVYRWLRWYQDYDNFKEVKLLISTLLRKSCVRTLAAKYRIHESEIEKRFDSELCRIPSIGEVEQEPTYETSYSHPSDNDEALMYGISYSGLCLISLARMVSQSRPCNCFVLGCSVASPSVYTLHAMERQKFPGWKTGFASCIHPSLNKRRIGLCKKHLKDLYLGHISLQSIDFGAWNRCLPAKSNII
ncbi:LOW QUALITY PROTEIN: nuclear intron maturase 4, mitochondrial-like [Hibiscus syriacus]|uniref:LOW QUALITY PROTEIN: nuclear intron maturase 4, mitochondrial-like n=1 Tax=Hibiscus syriacus TaxID=106335 RepID=UPI001923EC32|nr:LOW QUALITY PROTEIN: nuclear intron maturase 4, mitochondrial-like [Hibiscus syriacus]